MPPWRLAKKRLRLFNNAPNINEETRLVLERKRWLRHAVLPPQVRAIGLLHTRHGTRGREWDGIRNYQARNHLRAMKVGDKAFFYHSKSSPPGIVGTVKIVRTARPDPTAYDPQSEYYDPKSSEESCRWDSVLVEYEQTFPEMLSLKELKDAAAKEPEGVIANLALLKQSRLSVVPVTAVQWEEVMSMINKKNSGNGIETGGEKRRRKTE